MFFAARGHDGLIPAEVSYRSLGDDLLAVADAHDATRALGASMGAGALLSVLARHPDRFDRVVSFLPAAIDRPRTDAAVRRLDGLATALETGDRAAVEELVRAEVPEDLLADPAVQAYQRTRVAHLLAHPGIAVAVRSLPAVTPVPDRAALGAVTAEVLVLAQEGDALHPAQVARELVAVLPRARLVVFDRPGVMFRERPRLRALVTDFLNG